MTMFLYIQNGISSSKSRDSESVITWLYGLVGSGFPAGSVAQLLLLFPLFELPSICNWSAMISVVQRSVPSCACHLRVRSLPSMYTCEPFFRYCPITSAVLRNAITVCHSVCSFFRQYFYRSNFRSLQD